MKARLLLALLFCLAGLSWAKADPAIESAQRKLKDQGFYYGEIHGKKDADTTAAIRRYQIRNGLQITGELDAATQRALGLTVAPSSSPRPKPSPNPSASTAPKAPENSRASKTAAIPLRPPTEFDRVEDKRSYVPGPHGLRPGTSGIFDGTPFEVAPPDVQRRVIIGAQTILARRGLYRSAIDGVYGPGLNFALRTHQARLHLPPTGRFDLDTLATLGLLPGQRRPGFGPSPRRRFPPRTRIGPDGERVYFPDY
jgi:peptidoglycan hydrolase-like protein with peptidoglycan-binding domain